jgi:hypothetical protein
MIGAPAVLAPLFLQVALTFVLLFWSGILRFRTVVGGEVHARDVALRQLNWPPHVAKVTNAFQNQLELPVLFHLVIILAFFTAQATLGLVVLAWLFVATRVLHAVVHVTTNNLGRRFLAFFAGTLVLAAMWVIFILDTLLGG